MEFARMVIQRLRFEVSLMAAACRSPACAPSLVPVLASVGYLILPNDLIPDRIPVFGYLDDAVVLACGLIVARLLLPPELVVAVAERVVPSPLEVNGPHANRGHLALLQARQLVWWLIARRRLVRLKDHIPAFVRRTRLRLAKASRQRTLRDFAFYALGFRLWWRIQSPFARRISEAGSLVVIGGSPRSGTTLLRRLLGRHSMIVSGPETTVFLRRISRVKDIGERLGWDPAEIEGWQRESRSQMEFIELFQRAMLERSGKLIWAEKTPRNAGRFRFVRRHFPKAKLVHIIRDGRDVVCSLRQTPFARIDHAPPAGVKAAVRCAVQWQTLVEAGLRLRGDPGYYEIRYENLVREPERELRALVAFLGLPWEDQILEAALIDSEEVDENAAHSEIFGSSVGRWQRDLSPEDCQALQLLIGPTLIKLEYGKELGWADLQG
jgi:protein-tyrosine sulfotransferase